MPADAAGTVAVWDLRFGVVQAETMRRGMVAGFVFPLALLATGAVGYAQMPTPSIRLNVLRPMDLGRLIDGVGGDDRTGRATTAEFELIGPPGASVELQFNLPPGLNGEHGERVPLTFGPTSGAWSASSSDLDMVVFDPRAPTTILIPPSGRVAITLKGSAYALHQLRSGPYSGQITLLARIQ
ncbi:MAG TPA: hypothetical protein VMH39_02375 [Gemmatimonadaceae bacterium]|nr:hypothetical protein [Gemmatimonadaceae bacterium]